MPLVISWMNSMMQAIKRKKYLIISGLILIISLLTIYYILNKTDDIDSYDAERIIELREVDVESNAELMLNEDSAASEYTIIMPIAETR